jgi:SAM-dependent methyltransferase
VDDPRDEYIKSVVRGRSFADVGGLWGAVNEKVSVAHRHGAQALAMIDVAVPENELWQLFEARRRALGLPAVECLSGDIVTLVEASHCPQFDVVHCSGVLYHVPDPLRLLGALRKITREYLILCSVVTALRVESERGVLDIPQASALFIPALQGRERAILKSYWQRFVGDGASGLTHEGTAWRFDDFSPWWWLPTVEAFKAMCTVAGFHCQDGTYFWDENAYTLLLSVAA